MLLDVDRYVCVRVGRQLVMEPAAGDNTPHAEHNLRCYNNWLQKALILYATRAGDGTCNDNAHTGDTHVDCHT
jgi:hypothetical protein